MPYLFNILDTKSGIIYVNKEEHENFVVFKYFKHAKPCYFIVLATKDDTSVYTSNVMTPEMEIDNQKSVNKIITSKEYKKFLSFSREEETGILVLRNSDNNKHTFNITCNEIAYKVKIENVTSDKILLDVTTMNKNIYFETENKDVFMLKIENNKMKVYSSTNRDTEIATLNNEIGEFRYKNYTILIFYEKVIATQKEILISELNDIIEFIEEKEMKDMKKIVKKIYLLVIGKTYKNTLNNLDEINKVIDDLYITIVEKKLNRNTINNIYDIIA